MHITVTYQNGPDKTVMGLEWSLVLSTAGEITDYSSRETERWHDDGMTPHLITDRSYQEHRHTK